MSRWTPPPSRYSYSTSAFTEPLCCCEYLNMQGEKSHVLATCCDCEALDETIDKFFKCERIPLSTLERLSNTITDRCRVPTCFGRGAIKVRPDVVIPLVTVPACLCVATLHPVMTVLSFLFMPVCIVMYHALWVLKDRNKRNLFFYTWAVTSVICSYLVFQFFVVVFREVLLWEILTVFSGMMVMFYFLHLAKEDPDLLKVSHKPRPGHRRTPSNIPLNPAPLYDQISGKEVDQTSLYSQEMSDVVVEGNGQSDSSVKWVESRPSGGTSDLPARAGYCKICDSYIAVRDHHCVWIDSCVGASNHRSFLLAMITFVLTGIYASHLTFTTICTPRMYWDWFLLPNDCRWLYVDFLTAICWVTAVYVTIATGLMCVGLLFQFILISQNVTSHELAHARRQGQTRCLVFALNNPNNQGFFRNWMEFWMLDARTANQKNLS